MKVGISLGSHEITDLDYADDIALLANNESDLQFFVDQVVMFGSMLGLAINADKTEVMSICSLPLKICISVSKLQVVDSFWYLGSLITTDSSCEHDVLSRIGLAQVSFQQLYPSLFSRQDISINTKMRCIKHQLSQSSCMAVSHGL